jgi:hypothetical protein
VTPNSIVILSLQGPKEKVWGELLAITPAGITIRGVDINFFEELLRQAVAEKTGGAVSTAFYPMHRVERMTVDEGSPDVPSLADRFQKRVGASFQEFFAS